MNIDFSGVFFGLFFVVVGVAMIMFQKSQNKKCTEVTTATVIDNVHPDHGSTVGKYMPVFQYIVNGQTITQTSSLASKPKKYEIGDKVELHYNPDNVNEYYVPGYNSSKLGIIFILAGLGFLALIIAKGIFLGE